MLALRTLIFLEVASNLSFSKASKRLFISQSAVSRHIQIMEAQYNCALFDRRGNSIELTDIGQKIYSSIQDALTIQRKIEYDVSTIHSEADAAGIIKIGASTTVSLYILPEILSGFHKIMPNVQIHVVNRNTENIVTALISNQIDVGIVEVENKINKLNYEYFTSDKVIAVCASKSKLSNKTSITLDELLTIDIALREFGSGTLSALSSELLKQKMLVTDLKSKIRLGGTEALKNFILADLSLGFLPQKAVRREISSGELIEVKIKDFEIKREFFFLTRCGESFDLTKKFIKFSKQHVSY